MPICVFIELDHHLSAGPAEHPKSELRSASAPRPKSPNP